MQLCRVLAANVSFFAVILSHSCHNCWYIWTGKPSGPAAVDFSRLNVRVGRILKARHHPDASGLYIEEGGLYETFAYGLALLVEDRVLCVCA